MPYEVKKASGKGFEVVNKVTGHISAHHSTYENALKQVRLLYALEHDMKPAKHAGSYDGRRHDMAHMEGSQMAGKY